MSNIKQRIAYLQGLAQGLDIDDNTKEGRVLTGIIGVLEEMAEQIDDIETEQIDLEDYVESIDEDLFDLEGNVYGEDDLDDNMIEVECPKCQEIVCFDEDIVFDDDLIEVTCPNCDEVVYVNDEDALDDINDEVIEMSTPEEDF